MPRIQVHYDPPPPATILETLEALGSTDIGDMVDALVKREDSIADTMRNAGVALGTDPAFVAKVLMDLGIGTTPDEPTRDLIEQNFAERVQFWTEQSRRQGE